MEIVQVAAALIVNKGKYLITKRKPEVHLGNYWEFPGGKQEKGEDLSSCLVREVREELGITVRVEEEILVTSHDYPDRKVVLHFFLCEWKSGEIESSGCQEFRWVEKNDLENYPFPPANDELIRRLKNF